MSAFAWHWFYGLLHLALLIQPRTPRTAPLLDRVPFPSGVVIVVVDDLKKAVDKMQMSGIVITPERYRELLEKARKADEQAPANAAPLFDTCRLTGKVTGDFIELQAEVRFKTNTENVTVPIAFKEARFLKATLNGETPVWSAAKDGFALQVKEPREYRLLLDMQVKINRLDAERKVSLDIPSSATTQLQLVVPYRVQNVFVNKGGQKVLVEAEGSESRLRADALGVLDHLDLTWEVASAAAEQSRRQLTVQADMRIDVKEKSIESDVHVQVEVRRGTVGTLRWRLGESTPSAPLSRGGGRGGFGTRCQRDNPSRIFPRSRRTSVRESISMVLRRRDAGIDGSF